MLMFCLLYSDDIDKVYDSDDDLLLTQMVIQLTIGVITEDYYTKYYEDDESYEDCVVIEDDLDAEDNVESKGKCVVT